VPYGLLLETPGKIKAPGADYFRRQAAPMSRLRAMVTFINATCSRTIQNTRRHLAARSQSLPSRRSPNANNAGPAHGAAHASAIWKSEVRVTRVSTRSTARHCAAPSRLSRTDFPKCSIRQFLTFRRRWLLRKAHASAHIRNTCYVNRSHFTIGLVKHDA
jgi:hypothetical protein